MNELERINDVRNRVFNGFGPGKDVLYALSTNSDHIYRVTGMHQISDIVNTGYIRPKEIVRGGHKKEVFWSLGGSNLYYISKKPVLEVARDTLVDGQIGALPLEALTAIYIFSEDKDAYVNRLDFIKKLRQEKLQKELIDQDTKWENGRRL